MGCLDPNPAALDWQHLKSVVVQRGSHTLGAVPPASRAEVAAAAGAHGLMVRRVGGLLVLELAGKRGTSAIGPRGPRR